MLGQYLPLLMLFGLAVLFAAGSFIASGLLAPRNPTNAKRLRTSAASCRPRRHRNASR